LPINIRTQIEINNIKIGESSVFFNKILGKNGNIVIDFIKKNINKFDNYQNSQEGGFKYKNRYHNKLL
jgi:hypothetical protein